MPMLPVPPVCQAMVLCDEVQRVEGEDALNLQGVRRTIRAADLPHEHAQLCVYLELTGHEGNVPGFIMAMDGDSDDELFHSRTYSMRLDGPLSITPLLFRLRRCRFPAAGLYWIQFYCQGQLLVEHRLYVT